MQCFQCLKDLDEKTAILGPNGGGGDGDFYICHDCAKIMAEREAYYAAKLSKRCQCSNEIKQNPNTDISKKCKYHRIAYYSSNNTL